MGSNLSRLPRRVVGGMGVEEDASADGRLRGHRLVTPTYTGLGERAHLANPSIDLETHIQDILNVIKYEDLRDIVLIGHSYGGMVATGVADRARDRIAQLIYLDAFVPDDGQSLLDLNEPARPRMQELAKAGDGWRVPPNPTPPDTPQADVEWLTARRVDMPIKCFEMPLKLHGGKLTLPRSYIYATRITPADTFGPFARRAKSEAGLALLRDRRQPFAERHRAGGTDGAAGEDRRGASEIRHSGRVIDPRMTLKNGEGSGALRRTPHFV